MTIKLKHIPLLNIDLFYWFHAAFGIFKENRVGEENDWKFERSLMMTLHTSNLTSDLSAPRSFIGFNFFKREDDMTLFCLLNMVK